MEGVKARAVKKPKTKADKQIAFCERIAKMELGCAPSCGFMEQLILQAREALK